MRLALALALAAAAFAADDPGGWTSAKWGMSEAQVRAAVPAAVELTGPLDHRTFYRTNAIADDKWVAPIGIPSLDLAGAKWEVFFLFDRGKLARIELAPSEKSAAQFQAVEDLLAIKYGHPFDRQTTDTIIVHTAQWSFPSTVIVLRHTRNPVLAIESLYLTYERRSDPPL
jgi:hypothetical protein